MGREREAWCEYCFFFFNDTATTEIYTLSLHDALPISDLNAFAKELIAKGVPLAGTMEDFTDESGNVRTIFVYDPDGILVQFDEGPPAY
mgnify:CR=1 FL=1